MKRLASYILWISAIPGCGVNPGNPEGEAPYLSYQVRADTPVNVRVISPARVHLKDTLPLMLELANVGTDSVTLEFGGRPVLYDFVILDASGAPVWNWRATRADTIQPIGWFRTLEPKEVIRYHGAWNLRNRRGKRVAPGTYYLIGRVPSTHSTFYQSNRKPVTILP